MEIYTNTGGQTLSIPIPDGIEPADVNGVTSLNVTVRDANDGVTFTFPTAVRGTADISVAVPFQLVDQDRSFNVLWQFVYVEAGNTLMYERTTPITVVTPLIPISEVQAITGLEQGKAMALERKVRYIIQRYTGQSFGKFTDTLAVVGAGEGKLALPYRLLSFTSITGSSGYILDPARLTVYGDGWYLGYPYSRYKTIKEAPEEIIDGAIPFNGVIYSPNWTRAFRNEATFLVTGTWGYNEVPGDVAEAARILVEDYACDDSVYRERYITAVSAADWSLEFNPSAFDGTGNVAADQLLSGYQNVSMVVI